MALQTWFIEARSYSIAINGPILLEKAQQFCDEYNGAGTVKATPSWLERWKVRRGISCKTISGEEKSVTKVMTSSWMETTLPTLLSNYALKNIFNANEFGVFYAASHS